MNMKNYPFVIVLFILFFVACKEQEPGPDPNPTTFAAVIDNSGTFDPVVTSETVLDSTESTETQADGSVWICKTQTVSANYGAGGNKGFPLYNPNASVIYPGSLLQGNSLGNATPNVIAVNRAGGTISIDIVNGSPEPAFSVDQVTKSSISTALNGILSRNTGVVPANFSFDYASVQSRKQFALELGVDVSTAFVDVESNLSFSTDRSYNRYYVSLTQQYYTMSFDIPTSVDQLFASDVTPEDLAKYVGPGNPATYISDVTYGRIFYMLIESTSSRTEIDAAVSGSFSGVVNSVDIDLDVSSLSTLQNVKVKVFALGGDAPQTIATIGETNLHNLVTMLAESSSIDNGVPLSYVVRAVSNNQIVGVQLATEYDVKDCYPLANQLPTPMLWFDAAHAVTASDGSIVYSQSDDSYTYMNDAANKVGTVVSRWPDDSPNENDATAASMENRPVYIPNALNGLPAVEFASLNKNNSAYPETFLQYDGNGFVDSDYTIFMVMATPERVLYKEKSGSNTTTKVNATNTPGYFLYAKNSSGPRSNLFSGFANNTTYAYGHTADRIDKDVQVSASYRVITLRFSKAEGMKIYVNGVLIGSNSIKDPLLSYNAATIGAGYHTNYSRVRIAEIRAYDAAFSESLIQDVKSDLDEKYGL